MTRVKSLKNDSGLSLILGLGITMILGAMIGTYAFFAIRHDDIPPVGYEERVGGVIGGIFMGNEGVKIHETMIEPEQSFSYEDLAKSSADSWVPHESVFEPVEGPLDEGTDPTTMQVTTVPPLTTSSETTVARATTTVARATTTVARATTTVARATTTTVRGD